MARETAAEKRAREAKEWAEREAKEWAEFTATYPVRFANLLFKYMELSHAQFLVKKLDVDTYSFFFKANPYRSYELKVVPPVNYSWDYMDLMDCAERQLADYYAEVAEAERKANVRRNALTKLTAEERELLNLN